jgi:hypothetical protein
VTPAPGIGFELACVKSVKEYRAVTLTLAQIKSCSNTQSSELVKVNTRYWLLCDA